jgi:hypothetical protein
VDWTIVVTTAITGVVGVAGVVGGVINGRFAGDSARKSAELNITAEADRTRLAEKRRIYARALVALNSAALAAGEARAVGLGAMPSDKKAESKFHEAWRAANEAVAELQLIAPDKAVELAKNALDSVSDPKAYAGHREKLLEALRDDLGREARRAY